MKNQFNFTSALRTASLAIVLGLFSMVAQAGIVNYNFSVTIENSTTAGALANQTYGGSFGFDDTTGASGIGTETVFSLTSFTFNFNGQAYGLADLDFMEAVFEGATFAGLDVSGVDFSFISDSIGFAPYFAFDNSAGQGFGDLTAQQQAVPEPASAALMLVALGLLGGVLRRKNT